MAQFFRDAASVWPPESSSFPRPPPRPLPWLPPPRPLPSRPPPSPSSKNDQSSSKGQGGVVAGLVAGFVALLFLFAVIYSLCKWRRESRARARAAAWAAQLRPQAEHRERGDDGQRQLQTASDPRPTARLPAFTYNQSLKHNATVSGEEAATCSVCLGVFQHGESVRLLPVCLHLFHAECIDPWLDGHSTCPICRSETDPAMDVPARSPPV